MVQGCFDLPWSTLCADCRHIFRLFPYRDNYIHKVNVSLFLLLLCSIAALLLIGSYSYSVIIFRSFSSRLAAVCFQSSCIVSCGEPVRGPYSSLISAVPMLCRQKTDSWSLLIDLLSIFACLATHDDLVPLLSSSLVLTSLASVPSFSPDLHLLSFVKKNNLGLTLGLYALYMKFYMNYCQNPDTKILFANNNIPNDKALTVI